MNGIESVIGYSFREKSLLKEALTHSSASEKESNERLEFLGDAVLSLLVAERLYREQPDMDEGDMTLVRTLVVEMNALAGAAKRMGVDKFIRIGKQMRKDELPPRVLAGLFEALLGAVYLDGGLEEASAFVERHLGATIKDALERDLKKDYKSLLQEWAHRNFGSNPFYRLVAESGPEHSKSFRVRVEIDGKVFGYGEGKSKKEAEQRAAQQTLSSLKDKQ